jgi:hypothetical protein
MRVVSHASLASGHALSLMHESGLAATHIALLFILLSRSVRRRSHRSAHAEFSKVRPGSLGSFRSVSFLSFRLTGFRLRVQRSVLACGDNGHLDHMVPAAAVWLLEDDDTPRVPRIPGKSRRRPVTHQRHCSQCSNTLVHASPPSRMGDVGHHLTAGRREKQLHAQSLYTTDTSLSTL